MNIKKTMLFTILLVASLGSAVMVIGKAQEQKKSEPAIISLTNDDFEAVVSKAELPVIVDFYADWCGPCKKIKPMFDQLAQEHSDKYLFAKVDIDTAGQIAKKYEIVSIPTFVVIKNGTVHGKFSGGFQKDDFEREIEKCLAEEPSENSVTKAPQMPTEMLLMQAITAGNAEQLSEILQSGDIDVNNVIKMTMPLGKYAGKEIEYTILTIALSQGNKDIVRVLLDAGASLETKFKSLDGFMVTAFESLEKSVEEAVNNKNEMKEFLDSYKKEKTK